MAKISIEDLIALFAKEGVTEEDLAPYFIVDEEASEPFAPRFRLNPDTVTVPRGVAGEERTALAMNGANWFARMYRKDLFYKKLRSGYDGPVIVSEGDSWFQYPLRLKDTIDHVMDHYAVYSLGAAGDLLERMAKKQEYLRALDATGASILLFSGGGNDLVANGALANHLEEYQPDLLPGDYLKPTFQRILEDAFGYYERILRQVHGSFPHVAVICHGYDYPVPAKGRWLGKPMESRNIRDRALQKAIAAEMIDQFNRGLRRLCRSLPHATYLDCRGVVRDDRWYDELHPQNAGYGDVAGKFVREIKKTVNTRAARPTLFEGPFGVPEQVARALQPAPNVISGTGAKGMSLHLGLNSVDSGHYAGWDGRLMACENDARAMADLAARQGFEPVLLLTHEAKRDAVVAEIERAAATLGEGDMFFMTVSGHGGRIPDFNRDEEHDGDLKMDETLCLFDFQIADDELYMLWTKFAFGVRVLMMPDTCHSGSMVRFNPFDPFSENQSAALVVDPRVRAMPRSVEARVWRANLEAYRDRARSFEGIRESVVLNPLTTPIKASVLNLGACQDHQQAMDGDDYGAFTGAVLQAWDSGRFSGDYEDMRERADKIIGSSAQTPSLFNRLVKDTGFVRQVPFTLFPGRGTTVLGAAPRPTGAPHALAGVAPVAEPAPAEALALDEGEENDPLAPDQIDAIAAAKESRAGFRDANAALTWPDYADFCAFIKALGLKYFSPDEFLVLGGSHNAPGSPCAGKNAYPPRALWSNIANTARALDRFRGQVGKPVIITNAYRAPAYNSCIGGVAASQHKEFCALDFAVQGMNAFDAAMSLRWMRDRERAFTGGIGRYDSFVHIDTRGVDATWPDAFKTAALPTGSPFGAEAWSSEERTQRLSEIELAPRRRGTPANRGASAFAREVARDGEGFDPTDETALDQQKLKAAVDASSVISFVQNLTPGQKEDVLLSTLFAQRAADALYDPIADRKAWFKSYMDTLGVMGWARESAPFEAQEEMRSNGRFDQVILATFASIATGNQLQIINSAIEALRGLADDDNKIRLFDFETSRREGGNFQIGAAEAAGEVVSMALGAFNFLHEDKKRNILFVSWGENELRFWLSAQKMSLSPSIYADVRDLIRERLKETRKTLIADIPIA